MPVNEQDIKKVEAQRKKAAESISTGRGIEATATTVGDILMEGVRADRAKRGVSKLATDRGNVMGQLVTDPNRIRDLGTTEGFRMDPLNVDAYTSQARAQNLRTLGTVAQQSKENEGTLQEVIQAGANQLNALAQQKYAEAEQAKSEADALYERLLYEANRADRAFDEMMAREKLKGSGKGGGTRKEDYADFVDDASQFKELIDSGQYTYEQAREILKQVYPWANDEDINTAVGTLNTNPELREQLLQTEIGTQQEPGFLEKVSPAAEAVRRVTNAPVSLGANLRDKVNELFNRKRER